MSTEAERDPTSYTCGGCDNRWRGVSRAHCSAAGCHRTFAGAFLFDRHRRDVKGKGTCLDPATILAKDGTQEMFLTDGVWQSVESPADRGKFLRAWRAAAALPGGDAA